MAGIVAACVVCCAFPVVGLFVSSVGLAALTSLFTMDVLWKILAWSAPVVIVSLGYYLHRRKGARCDVSSCRPDSTDTKNSLSGLTRGSGRSVRHWMDLL